MADTIENPAPQTNPNVTPLPVEVVNAPLEIMANCDLPVVITNCSVSVDLSSDAAIFVRPEDSTVPETVAVGTTVLTVLGANSWTEPDPDGFLVRYIEVTNCNGAPIFVRTVGCGCSAIVSATDYEDRLFEGERAMYALSQNQEMQIVRASGAGNVCARRHVR